MGAVSEKELHRGGEGVVAILAGDLAGRVASVAQMYEDTGLSRYCYNVEWREHSTACAQAIRNWHGLTFLFQGLEPS